MSSVVPRITGCNCSSRLCSHQLFRRTSPYAATPIASATAAVAVAAAVAGAVAGAVVKWTRFRRALGMQALFSSDIEMLQTDNESPRVRQPLLHHLSVAGCTC